MVSVPPAPPDCGTASDAEAEAVGSFRLFRDYGQFRSLVPPAIRGGSAVAEVVGSPETGRHHALGSLRAVVAAFSAASGASGPLSVLSGSESMTDEPAAGNLHVWICGSPGWVTTQGDPAEFPIFKNRQCCASLEIPDFLIDARIGAAIVRIVAPPAEPATALHNR
jgi:hypothetical protein